MSDQDPSNDQSREPSFNVDSSSISDYEPSQAEIETTRMQLIAAFLLIQQNVQTAQIEESNQQTQAVDEAHQEGQRSPREALLFCEEVLEDGLTNPSESAEASSGTDIYTHWCSVCEVGTYYSHKPYNDYPLPLCLSDQCLRQFIITTAKTVALQLEHLIEYSLGQRGGGKGKRERKRRQRRRKRDRKRQWVTFQQYNSKPHEEEDHDSDSSDADN